MVPTYPFHQFVAVCGGDRSFFWDVGWIVGHHLKEPPRSFGLLLLLFLSSYSDTCSCCRDFDVEY